MNFVSWEHALNITTILLYVNVTMVLLETIVKYWNNAIWIVVKTEPAIVFLIKAGVLKSKLFEWIIEIKF